MNMKRKFKLRFGFFPFFINAQPQTEYKKQKNSSKEKSLFCNRKEKSVGWWKDIYLFIFHIFWSLNVEMKYDES